MSLLKRLFLLVVMTFVLSTLALAITASQEQEPNNSPAQANSLNILMPITGDIAPAGDVDYFAIHGDGSGWGTVAVLDVSASQHSWDGVVTMLAPDGTTVLGQNDGAWQKGVFLAWHNYQNRQTHYMRVSEQGNDDTIEGYMLQIFSLPILDIPDREPNDTLADANTSSISHLGRVDTATDRDCYALYGEKHATLRLALNGDPQEHHNTTDFALRLYGPDGSLLDEADGNPAGRGEFIDKHVLDVTGVYTYCVEAHNGTVGEVYRVGPIYQGHIYSPPFQASLAMTPPTSGDQFHVGDLMRYRVAFTSTSPLPIPDEVTIALKYDAQCQSVVDEDGGDTSLSGTVKWTYPDGIGPHMTLTKNVTLRADHPCRSRAYMSLMMDYYISGWGLGYTPFRIGYMYFLPALSR